MGISFPQKTQFQFCIVPYLCVRLEHLTMPVLIDRLVMRKHFYLAIRMCQYLKIPESEGASRILAHWACYKVNIFIWPSE